MNKYVVIYRVPVATMEEWRKNTSPEDMKAQSSKLMNDMNAWMAQHEKSFVDRGMPLGKTKTVSAAGVVDSKNDLNYFAIIEASSHDEAAKMFADNPHVTVIPNSTIDIMEIPHMGA